nr:hypothetical protein [Polyangiaceae bacterium]
VEPRLDCSAPGPIERIEVIPKERSLRAGDTFIFRSSGRDAKGCSVPNSPARFLFVSADPNVNVTVEPGGKVVVAGESKEGHAKLRVEIGGKEAIIDISVVSSAQYNELLRRNEPSVQNEEVTNLVNTSTVQTAPASATGARTWVYLAAAVVGFLGLIAAVLLRKRKTDSNRDDTDVIPNEIHSSGRSGAEFTGSTGFTGVGERSSVSKMGSTMVLGAFRDERGEGGSPTSGKLPAANAEEWICPTCLAPREKNATFCSKDGSRVVLASSIDRGAPQHACPVCRRSFGAGVATCPEHGESLVPIRTVAMPKMDAPKNVTKVCPKCGAKYAANVVYCGVDGETLALLN